MKYVDINPKDWPPLRSLEHPDLPELPENCLPNWAGAFANAVSNANETPLELAASIVVAVCSLATARTMKIRIEGDYCEAPVLWTVCALPSGNRKSSTHSTCTAPLRDWELDQEVSARSALKMVESERKTLEARALRLRTKAADGSNEKSDQWMRECAELESNLPDIPQAQRLWTSDSTPEKLADMLANYGEIFGWFSSEAGFFDTMRGRYSSMPNLDLILNSHSGEASTADRKGSSSVLLKNPLLAIGLTVQPYILSEIADSSGLRGKGLLARFMYFIPRSPLGYREFNTTPVPAEITAEYKKQIREMIDWCSQDSDGEPKIVTLNNDALEMWKEFRDDIEHRMRPGADLCELTDFGGKAPGAAARVACVFHAIDMVADGQQPWEVPISFETMNSALRFTKCAIEHSIHSFQTMGFCTEANAPRDILKWLERNNHRPPNVRDIYNGLRGRYPKADPIHKAVKLLQNYGYVRTHQKAKSGAGQPASPVVEIRPGLFS